MREADIIAQLKIELRHGNGELFTTGKVTRLMKEVDASDFFRLVVIANDAVVAESEVMRSSEVE